MINLYTAIFALNPSIVTIRENIAFDANEQEVVYDLETAQAKLIELQAAEESAKQSGLAKLSALGLTQDEVKALVG